MGPPLCRHSVIYPVLPGQRATGSTPSWRCRRRLAKEVLPVSTIAEGRRGRQRREKSSEFILISAKWEKNGRCENVRGRIILDRRVGEILRMGWGRWWGGEAGHRGRGQGRGLASQSKLHGAKIGDYPGKQHSRFLPAPWILVPPVSLFQS